MQPLADPGYRLTDEDTEALLSLHNTFQKCVVRFSSVSLFCFLVSVLLHLPSNQGYLRVLFPCTTHNAVALCMNFMDRELGRVCKPEF